MKTAAYRAMMWFFGAIIVIVFLVARGDHPEKTEELEFWVSAAFLSFIVAAFIFFKTLYDNRVQPTGED